MEDNEYYKRLMKKYKDVKVSKVIVTSQDDNGKWSSKVENDR